MSNPLDATPMQLREELAIVWSIVEQEKEFSSRLKKALTEREKQVKLLRDALERIGKYPRVRGDELGYAVCRTVAAEALAATEVMP